MSGVSSRGAHSWWRFWRRRLRSADAVAAGLYGIVRGLEATLRYEWQLGTWEEGPPQGIYCVWHNRLLTTIQAYHQLQTRRPGWSTRPLAAFVSASKDGAFLSGFVRRYQCEPIRGSSSRRGAQAMVEARSLIRAGYNVAITPDGPRGPKYGIQPGAIQLARSFELPLIPLIVNARWKWQARSWDGFQTPRPGSKIEFILGAPVDVGASEAVDVVGGRLREAMLALTHD